MSEWWDEDAGCYRRSLVYKIFYVWGWPAIRWVAFRLPSEHAHHLSIRGIKIVGAIDTGWFWITVPFRFLLLFLIVICTSVRRAGK